MGEIVLFHYVMQKTGKTRDTVVQEYETLVGKKLSSDAFRFDGYDGQGNLSKLCPATQSELLNKVDLGHAAMMGVFEAYQSRGSTAV